MSRVVSQKIADGVVVEIHAHSVSVAGLTQRCWTYLTKGLEQTELSFTLVADTEDLRKEPPVAPLKLFAMLANHVDSLKPGGATRLGKSGLFGFKAIHYLPAIQFEPLPDMDGYLAILLIHESEYDFSKRFGTLRLLTQLNQICSSFPWPSWNSVHRPTAINDQVTSIVDDVNRIKGGVTVQIENDLININVRPDAVTHIADALGKDSPFACLSQLPVNLDSCLVWDVSADAPIAIAGDPDPATTAAVFVLFRTGPYSYVTHAEDGIVVTLTPSAMAAFANAVHQATPVELKLNHSLLRIHFAAQTAPAPQVHHSRVVKWSPPQPVVTLQSIETGMADEQLVHQLVSRMLEFLIHALEEETERFELQIHAAKSQVHIDGNIDLNPDFVTFLEQNLPVQGLQQELSLRVRIHPHAQAL